MSRLAKVLVDFGQIFKKEMTSPFLETTDPGPSETHPILLQEAAAAVMGSVTRFQLKVLPMASRKAGIHTRNVQARGSQLSHRALARKTMGSQVSRYPGSLTEA